MPAAFSSAEIYKYVDKNGVVHVTDNPAAIPEAYRDNLQTQPEIRGTSNSRPAGAEKLPAPAGSAGGTTPEPEAGRAKKAESVIGSAPAARSETLDQQAAKTSEADSGDTDQKIEELARQRSALMEKKQSLNEEYQALLDQRRALEAANQELESPEAVEAYNQRVRQLNNQIQAYRKRRGELEAEIQTFNAAINPPASREPQ